MFFPPLLHRQTSIRLIRSEKSVLTPVFFPDTNYLSTLSSPSYRIGVFVELSLPHCFLGTLDLPLPRPSTPLNTTSFRCPILHKLVFDLCGSSSFFFFQPSNNAMASLAAILTPSRVAAREITHDQLFDLILSDGSVALKLNCPSYRLPRAQVQSLIVAPLSPFVLSEMHIAVVCASPSFFFSMYSDLL